MQVQCLENYLRRFSLMSNYENNNDKLNAHLEQLITKHRKLDEELESRFHNQTITDEVRRLKTQKLWLKDEIHRIQRQLEVINGS